MQNNTANKLVKAILVDLDGTLLYTEKANIEAYRLAFAEVNLTFNSEIFIQCSGLRFDHMMQRMAPGVDRDIYAKVRTAKERIYPDCFEFVAVNEPLVAFLRSMKATTRLALVTTARSQNARNVLNHFNLISLFSILVFGDDVVNPKPAPDSYLKCLELLGLTASECIACEDSEVGIAAASSAAISVIKVA